MKTRLVNNKEKEQYEYSEGKDTALIAYYSFAEGVIALPSVRVPDSMAGKGVGTKMVQTVLEDVKSQGLKIVPICPFVVSFIQSHPEWEAIVYKSKD